MPRLKTIIFRLYSSSTVREYEKTCRRSGIPERSLTLEGYFMFFKVIEARLPVFIIFPRYILHLHDNKVIKKVSSKSIRASYIDRFTDKGIRIWLFLLFSSHSHRNEYAYLPKVLYTQYMYK